MLTRWEVSVMSKNKIMMVLLVLIFSTILAVPVHAAEVSKIQSASEVNTENGNYVLLPAIILALILAVCGFYLGMRYGKKIANKPDLLKIEQVILKYYGMRSEKPLSPVKISKECEAIFERAFDFNANRAEMLNSQKDQYGVSVDPNRINSPTLRPYLFQALYEKTQYGQCIAFDAGIDYLNKCLNEKRSKH